MFIIISSHAVCHRHLNLGHVIRVMNPSSKSTTTTISSSLSTVPASSLDTASSISTDPDISGGFNIVRMFCCNTAYFCEREGFRSSPLHAHTRRKSYQGAHSIKSCLFNHCVYAFTQFAGKGRQSMHSIMKSPRMQIFLAFSIIYNLVCSPILSKE